MPTFAETIRCFASSILSRSLACIILVPAMAFAGDEWPQFRGPDGQGHTDVVGLPLTWSETEHVAWKTPIPGEGHSSPVISGNQIWLTTAITKELSPQELEERLKAIKNSQGLQLAGRLDLQAICINRETGAVEKTVPIFSIDTPEPKHALNSYASPTPVISGSLVFCHFGTYGTAAIERDSGKVLWKNDALKLEHQNGPGSSPIVWENLVIVHLDGTDTQSIVALNRDNGEVVWQTKRTGEMDPTPELKKAYGTPLLVDVNDRPLLISPAANWVYGYDARDGKEIWKAAYGQLGFSTVPRPVIQGDRVYIATSYMQSRLLAVRFTGEGDVTSSHIAWMSDKQIPQKPSMIVVGQNLYFVSDKGIARCLNAESGEEEWFARLPGDYSASPLAAENHLYFFNQEGTCTVIKAGDEFEQIAQNKLDDGFMASPAVAGKALFLRTAKALYRIEGR
ncbi:MAG: PQQ-like beta-propeller repeat protein [Planctomycetaceae bacterium]|nr:PQQ-like beta-propeller repeat protein [Planctomycetaceae bacterium]